MKNRRMSITFNVSEIKELENAIGASTFSRSFSSHKKDMKKFLLAHFKKNKSMTKKSNKKVEDKISTSKKISSKEISSKKTSSKKTSNKPKEKSGPKDGYKIMEVTSGYGYPTSVYKKTVPMEAAESAIKGIIKKNKLEMDSTFTFSIKKENRAFRYTYENGKINAHHGR